MDLNKFLIIYSNQFPKIINILSASLLLVIFVLCLPTQAMDEDTDVTLQVYDVERDKNPSFPHSRRSDRGWLPGSPAEYEGALSDHQAVSGRGPGCCSSARVNWTR